MLRILRHAVLANISIIFFSSFQVSNMDNLAPYVFNIVNCEKSNSQFNYGMKPIIYSVREATLRRPGWFRTGAEICYYRNGYKVPHNHKKTFHTATFNIKFPHSLDVRYVAYTFPYPYSQLLVSNIPTSTCKYL